MRKPKITLVGLLMATSLCLVRQANAGHLCQPGALSAEALAIVAAAFRSAVAEEIDTFRLGLGLRHDAPPMLSPFPNLLACDR